MSHDDDMSDVTRVLGGDTEAFSGIVRRNQHLLLAFGRRFFSNGADVEDFVQEVFLQAYRRLSTFRGEGRFRSWLLGIAYHLAIRTKRRLPDYHSLEPETVPDTGETPERSLVRGEASRTILEAIRGLPERFATCVDLFFFFGLTYNEISATTGHPLNTVRSHIRRAKERLRETLYDDVMGGLL